ncbi:MAG: ABC transporter ATP-binding protein [Candidatus Acidiferrum sp.]|jgi:lipopolysaccharide transport system ATP-binding protein
MSTAVITAENLSKRYQRGMAASGLLRDTLALAVKAPHKLFRREQKESFWALKDVSLAVQHGEVLGLIGRNGSGKTTLLKILSRITRPTAGWAEIHGHVGSLLEVGTGFHPELTGRENAYLSGAILGMGKQEITRKFDEIVAFAELEKFIDTPVKHYSSGMYVRLAFAVAAHLEPEILLIDEVLAVGDIRFQKKCLGKMGEVARVGRTVILVTHQLNQIRRLCERVVWLDAGEVRQTGPAADVVSAYETHMSSGFAAADSKVSNSRAEFLRWWAFDEEGNRTHNLHSDEGIRFQFLLRVNKPVLGLYHDIYLYDQDRQLLWGNAIGDVTLEPGLYLCDHSLPFLPLRPGVYTLRATLWDGGEIVADWEGAPGLRLSTLPVAHPRYEKSGQLNIPSKCVIIPEGDSPSPPG